MAEWKNIFDLGDWDVYVQFYMHDYLIPIADLDPFIGAVTVVDGDIVCSFTSSSGSGNGAPQPRIVVMPAVGTPGKCRLTCSDVGFDMGNDVESSSLVEVESLDPSGPGQYEATDSATNAHDYAGPSDWVVGTELPVPIASGSGLSFMRIGRGF